MEHASTFRILTIILFVLLAATGVYHRVRAARSGEKISRREEGLPIMILLRLFGFSLWMGLLLYMINPRWMAWSTLWLPPWLRWVGAALGVLALPLIYWMFSSLGTNVISLMELLASYPSPRSLKPWEQDRLILKTIQTFQGQYRSPYQRRIEFPNRNETPPGEREALEAIVQSLGTDGIPDTVAYLTEEEIMSSMAGLEQLGYYRESIMAALTMPTQPIDYRHFSF